MPQEWSLYMVETANGHLYTGISTDVERRFKEHTEGKRGAQSLRGKGPLILRFHQEVGNRSLALKLEYAVKQLKRDQKREIIEGSLSLLTLLEK